MLPTTTKARPTRRQPEYKKLERVNNSFKVNELEQNTEIYNILT